MARVSKNTQFTGLACHEFARLRMVQGRWVEAFALLEEAYQCFDALGFTNGLTFSQTDLGDAALMRGMLDQAEEYYRRSIAFIDRTGIRWQKQYVWYRLGLIALRKGHHQEAEIHFREAIFDFAGIEMTEALAYALRGLAAVCADNDPRQAAMLEGHAAALNPNPDDVEWVDREVVTPRLAAARDALGEAEYADCAGQGARMSIREILSGSVPARQLST